MKPLLADSLAITALLLSWRIGITYVVKDTKFDHESPDTLAELLKRHDPRYVTSHIGK